MTAATTTRLIGRTTFVAVLVGIEFSSPPQLLVPADLPTPPAAEVYAVHAAGVDAAAVKLLAAAGLAGMLAPTPS